MPDGVKTVTNSPEQVHRGEASRATCSERLHVGQHAVLVCSANPSCSAERAKTRYKPSCGALPGLRVR